MEWNFTNSTVNWGGPVNDSRANFPLSHVCPRVVQIPSMKISCTTGDFSICRDSTIMPIFGLSGKGKTETYSCWILIIRLLNKFW